MIDLTPDADQTEPTDRGQPLSCRGEQRPGTDTTPASSSRRSAAERRSLRLRARRRCATRRSPRSPTHAHGYLGTSHRRDGVRSVVRRIRDGLGDLFSLPDGYEVLLGNGGSTLVLGRGRVRLDRAAQLPPRARRVLVEVRRGHARRAPSRRARRCSRPEPGATPAAARRTSRATCTRTRTTRRRPASWCRVHRPADGDALVVVDGTSAAGGMPVDRRRRSTSTTSRRRSASRATAASGSRACSPRAIERIERIAASGRWIPPTLDLDDRARQLAARPDLQHAGARDAVPPRPPDRVDARQRRARLGGEPVRNARRQPSTAGPMPDRGRRRS